MFGVSFKKVISCLHLKGAFWAQQDLIVIFAVCLNWECKTKFKYTKQSFKHKCAKQHRSPLIPAENVWLWSPMIATNPCEHTATQRLGWCGHPKLLPLVGTHQKRHGQTCHICDHPFETSISVRVQGAQISCFGTTMFESPEFHPCCVMHSNRDRLPFLFGGGGQEGTQALGNPVQHSIHTRANRRTQKPVHNTSETKTLRLAHLAQVGAEKNWYLAP